MAERAARIRNVRDAREHARRRVPRALFDYVDGASEDERASQDNCDAFGELHLLPRAAVHVPHAETRRVVLGRELSMPLILAPCGGVRLFYPDGDRAVLRAAGTADTAYAMSTATRTAPEDMMEGATGPLWFQLYFRGEPKDSIPLIDRIQNLGFGALFVTVDVSSGNGMLERLFSHQGTFPIDKSLRQGIHYAPQFARHPGWFTRFLLDGLPTDYETFARTRRIAGKPGSETQAALPGGQQKRPRTVCPTWDDLVWIREQWRGPLVVKGLLTPEDARRARDLGADGVVVSNHGGRQLDAAPATIRALPGVVAAVGDDIEVLIDGGIRRGSDIVKALALGARACMVGRPYIYGLAAAGQAGVERVLTIFRTELERTLSQVGLHSVDEIDASCLDCTRFTPAAGGVLKP
jgi:isopentenyl diphosphate isomerase/L-lactate dehydrogenase-like FMN-dependent dehydrogenase